MRYESKEEKEEKEPLKKSTRDDLSKFNEWVNEKETGIKSELLKKYFKLQKSSDMLKYVYKTNDKKKNSKLVNLIKSELSDLKNEIENIKEEEKEIEKPNEIVDIVEKIFEFNRQTKEGEGLKILNPNQIISRLSMTLVQLKAGNNSEKLKSEIRQQLYSLYRSKKLTKQLYESLVDII